MTDIGSKNLLGWHQVPEKQMGSTDNKVNKWVEIHSSNKAAPSFEPWTDEK